jgi:hypothetical protein
MKKVTIIFTGVILMSIASVKAQTTTSVATASSFASIEVPISISKVDGQDLHFGNIIADNDGGTVSIANDNTPGYVGVVASSIPGTRKAAEFKVTGYASALYSISTAVIQDLKFGVNTMPLVLNTPTAVAGTLGTLDGTTASQNLKVGGTITLGANQVAGQYTGSFSVTVNYN